MTYTPTVWADRVSGSPGQFSTTGSVPGNVVLTLNDAPSVTGTPVTAARMNNIETELVYLDALAATFPKLTVSQLVNMTSPLTAASYTPLAAGNFEVKVYLSVTATTTMTVTIFWTDPAGLQTNQLVNAQSLGVGGYCFPTIFFNAMPTGPITVVVTSSPTVTTYINAAIVGV